MKKVKLALLGLVIIIFTKEISVSAATIQHDFNSDGIVDIKDVAYISKFYNKNAPSVDLNKDGIIDIFDITLLAKSIDYSNFKVYDEKGTFIKGYNNGNLNLAINEALKLPNGFVMSNGRVVWDSTAYWVFNGETTLGKTSTAFQSINLGNNYAKGKVYTKQGILLLDKSIGYKGVLGVTSTSVNFRQGPSTSTASYGVLPDGMLLKVNSIAKSFFNSTQFKDDKSILEGYIYYDYLDIIQDDSSESYLGYVAAKYESAMDGSRISDNPSDKGGASFGAFQLSSTMGSLGSFISWLQPKAPEFYTKLTAARTADGNTYSTNFKNAWVEIASSDYDKFYKLQQEYIKLQYYNGFLTKARSNGYNVDELIKYTSTRNMIMSTAIQHGVTGAYNVFTAAGSSSDISYLIDRVYAERLNRIAVNYPPNSPDPGVVAIYNAVKSRFERECAEIKRLYQRELSY